MSKGPKILRPILASLLAIAFLSKVSNSGANTLDRIRYCLAKLVGQQKEAPRFKGLFKIQGAPVTKDPSVEEVGRDNQSGLITVRRIQDTWASAAHSSGELDYMGNPQWVLYAFGEWAAAWMGVRLMDDRTMTIFNGERAKKIIEEINKQLIEMKLEPIPINFYHLPPGQVLQSLIPYLKSFSEFGILPFSGKFNSLVHDFSYHFSSIIAPPIVVKLIRIQTRFLLKFVDHISNLHFETPTQTEHVKRILNDALDRQGQYIDAGTALFPFLEKTGDSPSFSTKLLVNLSLLYSDGRSSRIHIGRVITATQILPSEIDTQDFETIEKRLNKELKLFSKAHQTDPDFNFSFDPKGADLAGALVQRRDEVVRAIKVLSTK